MTRKEIIDVDEVHYTLRFILISDNYLHAYNMALGDGRIFTRAGNNLLNPINRETRRDRGFITRRVKIRASAS